MKPNSAVVELCPYGNDGRCLLGLHIHILSFSFYLRLFLLLCFAEIIGAIQEIMIIIMIRYVMLFVGGGPFSRAAVVLSHNYMIHHPPKSEFKWMLSDMTSEFNIERFILHISSYLQSVGMGR
jgi:hypothetical protein